MIIDNKTKRVVVRAIKKIKTGGKNRLKALHEKLNEKKRKKDVNSASQQTLFTFVKVTTMIYSVNSSNIDILEV